MGLHTSYNSHQSGEIRVDTPFPHKATSLLLQSAIPNVKPYFGSNPQTLSLGIQDQMIARKVLAVIDVYLTRRIILKAKSAHKVVCEYIYIIQT